MNDAVKQMSDKIKAQKEAERIARQKAIDDRETLHQLILQKILKFINENIPEVADYSTGNQYVHAPNDYVKVWFESPLYGKFSAISSDGENIVFRDGHDNRPAEKKDFAMFFAQLAIEKESVEEDRKEKQCADLTERMRTTTDLDYGTRLYNGLCETEPSKKSVWDGIFNEWLERYRADQERIRLMDEETQKLHQKELAKAQAWKEKLIEFTKQVEEIKAYNLGRVKDAQKHFDAPFVTQEIEYSIPGETLETKQISVMSQLEIKDSKGNRCLAKITYGGIEYWHFENVISWSLPKTVLPSEVQHRCYVAMGEEIFHAPNVERSEIEEYLALKNYPERPETPSDISHEIVREIEAEVLGEEELPF